MSAIRVFFKDLKWSKVKENYNIVIDKELSIFILKGEKVKSHMENGDAIMINFLLRRQGLFFIYHDVCIPEVNWCRHDRIIWPQWFLSWIQ
jgi:hypothetical protein